MTFNDLLKFTDNLYSQGLISYSPSSISSIDNTSKSALQMLEDNLSTEESWRNQRNFIRLTTTGEIAITGTDNYLQIIKENLSQQYATLKEISLETDKIKKEFTVINRKLDSSMVKNIEVENKEQINMFGSPYSDSFYYPDEDVVEDNDNNSEINIEIDEELEICEVMF